MRRLRTLVLENFKTFAGSHVVEVGDGMTAIVGRRRELCVYGPVPFGSRREEDWLVPVEDEIDIVRRIRELARLGQEPVAIAIGLTQEKCRWRDGSMWNWRCVASVLKNPVYHTVLDAR